MGQTFFKGTILECCQIHPGPQSLQGSCTVPGDKSLTHRALLLASLAQGTSQIDGWLQSGDTCATLAGIQQLGTKVIVEQNSIQIHPQSWHAPHCPLDLHHAGTGVRLLAGIMVGQPFSSVLDGSSQLRKRPMQRIVKPLQAMGARIHATDGHAPLYIEPAHLTGVQYQLPIASAQVKSAILLAALSAQGTTVLTEPEQSRDHTERLLQAMGVPLCIQDRSICITGPACLQPLHFYIPGDFSSAAFLIVAGLILPHSKITITNVNMNLTRTGLWDALIAMGGNCQVLQQHIEGQEPVATLEVQHSDLHGITIPSPWVVRMIDEFPILMVAALHAHGKTIVTGAQELRVKESDRLAVMSQELQKMGAQIQETLDGFEIQGHQKLHGAEVQTHDDHRIAMSLSIAALAAASTTLIQDTACTEDSFPNFFKTLQSLGAAMGK